MDKTIEQQARELLAEEFENGKFPHPWTADALRRDINKGQWPPEIQRALRAITRALTRPAPTEAEVEAAVARMADVPMGDVTAGECMTRAELERMARAALNKKS